MVNGRNDAGRKTEVMAARVGSRCEKEGNQTPARKKKWVEKAKVHAGLQSFGRRTEE